MLKTKIAPGAVKGSAATACYGDTAVRRCYLPPYRRLSHRRQPSLSRHAQPAVACLPSAIAAFVTDRH